MIEIRRSHAEGEKVEVAFRGETQDVYDLAVALHIQASLTEFGSGPIAFNSYAIAVIGKALHEFIDTRARHIESKQNIEAFNEAFKAKLDAMREAPEPKTGG